MSDMKNINDEVPFDGQHVYYEFEGKIFEGHYYEVEDKDGTHMFENINGGFLVDDVIYWKPF